MFAKFTEFVRVPLVRGALVRLKGVSPPGPKPVLLAWAQTCRMSGGGSNRKKVPCPCVPANKIRKYKKKKYERCDKPTPCPTVKHKCATEMCKDTKQKCPEDDQ